MFFHQIFSFFPRVKMENSRFIVSSVFEYQLHKPPNLGIITPEPVIDPAQIRILIQHFLTIVQKLVDDLPLRYIPKLATGNSRYPQTICITTILLHDDPCQAGTRSKRYAWISATFG